MGNLAAMILVFPPSFPCRPLVGLCRWICYGSVRLTAVIVKSNPHALNLNSIQTNIFLRNFVHVIQFSQACRIFLSFLSSQRSQGRRSNFFHCLYLWAPGWKAVRNSSVDEVHLVALWIMSTSICGLLFLRENFSTFQPLIVGAHVLWTQYVVSVQLSLVPKWKKTFHFHCIYFALGGLCGITAGIAGKMNMSRIFPDFIVFWHNYNFAMFNGLWHWCVQTSWYALKKKKKKSKAEYRWAEKQ